MQEYIYIDGKKIGSPLPLRSLFYGEGVFETFRYRYNLPLLLNKHLDRMRAGAKLLKIPYPENDFIIDAITNSVGDSKVEDAYVKICLLSTGMSEFEKASSASQLLVIIKEYKMPKPSVSLKINSFRKISTSTLSGIKSMNYLENILARREAVDSGFDEALFLNEWGEITECSASNIFWFNEGRLFTPLGRCGLLPGTTRQLVINLSKELGFQKSEGGYQVDNLYDAEFVFITNSLIGSTPVSSVEGTTLNINHPVYDSIHSALMHKLNWD